MQAPQRGKRHLICRERRTRSTCASQAREAVAWIAAFPCSSCALTCFPPLRRATRVAWDLPRSPRARAPAEPPLPPPLPPISGQRVCGARTNTGTGGPPPASRGGLRSPRCSPSLSPWSLAAPRSASGRAAQRPMPAASWAAGPLPASPPHQTWPGAQCPGRPWRGSASAATSTNFEAHRQHRHHRRCEGRGSSCASHRRP
mmetsp:Transcript_55502/g.141107  ORF Transcript_55502/g.141107 Transcript_55502/m.141107 type:complete len:201 (-) Transcript_55502:1220-1822(-)